MIDRTSEVPIGLNESHRRHVAASLRHAAELLDDAERILIASQIDSPFRKYTGDLMVADHIMAIRRKLAEAGEEMQLDLGQSAGRPARRLCSSDVRGYRHRRDPRALRAWLRCARRRFGAADGRARRFVGNRNSRAGARAFHPAGREHRSTHRPAFAVAGLARDPQDARPAHREISHGGIASSAGDARRAHRAAHVRTKLSSIGLSGRKCSSGMR